MSVLYGLQLNVVTIQGLNSSGNNKWGTQARFNVTNKIQTIIGRLSDEEITTDENGRVNSVIMLPMVLDVDWITNNEPTQ